MAFQTYPPPYPQGVSNAEWERMMLASVPDGVTSGYVVSAPTASTVRASAGTARVGGYSSISDAASSDLSVTTLTTGTRPDRMVLRRTWTGSSSAPTAINIAPAVKIGTVGTTTPPSLTQVPGGTWEIGLAQWTMTNSGITALWNEIRADGWAQVRSFVLGRSIVPYTGDEAGVLGYKLAFTDDTGNNSAVTYPTATTSGGTYLTLYGPGHYEFSGEVSFAGAATGAPKVRCEQSSNGGASWGIIFQRTYPQMPAGQNQLGFHVAPTKFASGDIFRVSCQRPLASGSEDLNGNMRATLVRGIPVL